MSASELDPTVKALVDPQGQSRQYLAARLEKLADTRIAGFVLSRQKALGKWGKATYALKKTAEDEDHRGHRGHRASCRPMSTPMAQTTMQSKSLTVLCPLCPLCLP